jgi:hypothetical protein
MSETRVKLFLYGGMWLCIGDMAWDYYRHRVQQRLKLGDPGVRMFLVDATPISKPGVNTYTQPSLMCPHMSLWYPRNGEVIIAKTAEDPRWVETQAGTFVQREMAGVELLVPVTEATLQEVRAARLGAQQSAE